MRLYIQDMFSLKIRKRQTKIAEDFSPTETKSQHIVIGMDISLIFHGSCLLSEDGGEMMK